jgi:hypothetical protein
VAAGAVAGADDVALAPIDAHRVPGGALFEVEDAMMMRRSSVQMRQAVPLVFIAIAILMGLAGGSSLASAARVEQRRFTSPAEAMTALADAMRAGKSTAIRAILGAGADALITSGDAVADRRARERFVQAYDEANRVVTDGDNKATITIGTDDWPFPIPLVKEATGWRFDTAAGKEEILNRRIGQNELNAIQVCLAYVDAQREYYLRADVHSLLQYAQKFASSTGKRDGLYWQTKPGETPSPLGPLLARARGDGYSPNQPGRAPVPYWGYYYRILKAQGKDAPGGAYDYLARGAMIGGFALVAFPAGYGSSGIMTFIVNHDGVVYQKDLGANTVALARAMTKFNPDATWKKL